MIPRIIHRTVPLITTDEVEYFWAGVGKVNQGFELITWRDPQDPDEFPISAAEWHRCTHGAQRAGLIRLEVLFHYGGIYVDSDWEAYRPFDPLLELKVFAGWEDINTIPDAVLGAEPGHPVIMACLEEAISVLEAGPWASGPGVMTRLLPTFDDVTLLPVEQLYPYHYSERWRRHEDHKSKNPTAYGAHHWAASWL